MVVPSTHVMYAGSPADFFGDGQSGGPLLIAGGETLTVWSELSAGEQVTDLYDASQDDVTIVTSDSFGNFRFYAPAALGTAWVSPDGGTTRYAVQRADLGEVVAQLVGQVADLEGQVGDAEAAREVAETFEQRLVAQEEFRAQALAGALFPLVAGGALTVAKVTGGSDDPTADELPGYSLIVVMQ